MNSFEKAFLCTQKYLLKTHNMKYSLTLQFFDPVEYVTNGIGRFSLGCRNLIIPKANECLTQRVNSKMQTSIIYLDMKLVIMK